jgi:NAD(P)-dependent dehydrogenase (short-subunit alcohol dehydrogenase family)
MSLLDDHVVLIVGGGSGLGLGVARYFLTEGAKLAILEISKEKADALREEFGAGVLVRQGDATSIADLEATRDAIVDRFGRLDAYVGCQGIFDGNIPLQDTPLDKVPDLFDEVFHVNVLAYVLGARVFYPELAKTGGAIVLTASVAAFAADGGGLFYTASKGAVKSIVNQLSFEFSPSVRVNGVAPAGIANSQLRGPAALGLEHHKQSDIPKDAFLKLFREVSTLPELPTPEDHGPLYAFLASRHNKIMTGTTVLADQGSLNRAFLSQPAAPER